MDANDGSEAGWLEMRGILAHQIAFFEAGNMVAPVGQDALKATTTWLAHLRQRLDEYDAFLTQYRPLE